MQESWTLVFFGLIVLGVGIGLAVSEALRRMPSAEYSAEACNKDNAESKDPTLRAAVQYAWGVSDYQGRDYKTASKSWRRRSRHVPNFYLRTSTFRKPRRTWATRRRVHECNSGRPNQRGCES